MHKQFLYRLYVNKNQSNKLNGILDITREIYNAALQERRDAWKYQHKSLSYYDQCNEIKEIRREIPAVAQLHFHLAEDALKRLDKSFKFFFNGVKNGEKVGYPRFKSQNRFNSITFPAYGNGVKFKGKCLYLHNVGLVKIKMHRVLEGEIDTVTIKRECEKWYVIFSNTVQVKPLPICENVVGVDVGLETFAVTSDGEFIENPRYLREAQRKLRVSQRSVSRKKNGGSNRRKEITLLAKKHLRIKRQRTDFAHKVADKLVKNYGRIAVEDLRIKNMVRNHHLACSISDASWGRFIDILSYKAEYAGRKFIKVNPNGTSQICSSCGSVVPKTLSVRIHRCPSCGLVINRDFNAALNIKRLGLSLWDLTCDDGQCVSQEAITLTRDRVATEPVQCLA
jgi:putative transposase